MSYSAEGQLGMAMGSPSIVQEVLRRPGTVIAFLFASLVLYAVSIVIYNLYFHPLAKFPGPKSYAATVFPHLRQLMKGDFETQVLLDMFNKYGDVVRIAPNQLAFSNGKAWKDIYGHRANGEEMSKLERFYKPVPGDAHDIIFSSREEHSRLRRQLAHGFSDKAMHDQEPIINIYVDLLIKRLHENCAGGSVPVNMMSWYNWTTFDIIGDLAFGEPFGCLNSSDYHPWIKLIFDSIRAGTYLIAAGTFPMIKNFLFRIMPKSKMEKRLQQLALTREKMLRRMEHGKERPDLIEGLLRKKDELGLSIDELSSNANILIIAGSETTATVLAGSTYLLLCNPSWLEKVTKEVRSTFQREEDINIDSVRQLHYMLACLDETMRMYPSVPNGLPRSVYKGGAQIADHYVPENAVVAVHQWATYHREENFSKPFEYHPERWLGDPSFANDKLDSRQPFSYGPRNCIGRNLAYTEMRIILARVLWNFDLKMSNESVGWMERQKVFALWDKGPLHIHLTPVARDSAETEKF